MSICLALGAATLSAFWSVIHHDFINFDDRGYVVRNLHARAGPTWATVKWAFTSFYGANWHPLTWLSHALDCRFYDLNPAGHHLTSILFHTANTLLVFLVLQCMTGAVWRSAFVAALFGLHPLHVESVAWVAERKDVLCAFFFLLSLWTYAAYVKSNVEVMTVQGVRCVQSSRFKVQGSKFSTSIFYALSLVLFACALMSKPMAVTFPFVLLVLDYWPLRRVQSLSSLAKSTMEDRESKVQSREPGSVEDPTEAVSPSTSHLLPLILEKVPFFVWSVVDSWLTLLAQHSTGAIASVDSFSLTQRILNAIVSCGAYIGKTFWPSGLAMYYPRQESFPAWEVFGAAAVLVAASFLALALVRRRPYLLAGWLWFLVMLLPVIGLVQVGLQARADRYTYLPLIGIFIALSWGLGSLSGHRCDQQEPQFPVSTQLQPGDLQAEGSQAVSTALPDHSENPETGTCRCAEVLSPFSFWKAAIVFAIIVSCWFLTVAQVRIWRDAVTLYRHTLQVAPHNPIVLGLLGDTLVEQHRFAEGAREFEAALKITPGYAEAESNLGFAIAMQGLTEGHDRLDEAIEHYRKAIALKPQLDTPHYVLSQALMLKGRRDESIAELRTTLALNPENPAALNDLTWILATDPDPAIRNGSEAVRLGERACHLTGYVNPLFVGTLAAAYAEAGRFDDAIKTGEMARHIAETSGLRAIAEKNAQLLAEYRAGKPHREPEPGTNPPP